MSGGTSENALLAAIGELRSAQRLAPSDPDLAVGLVEKCLQSNLLVCAAHGTRTLLRHPDDAGDRQCRFLASSRVFVARADALHWCPKGEPCGHPVANRSIQGAVSAGPLAPLYGGLMWSGENFVETLKTILRDEAQWQGPHGWAQLNHATMQHMQGNTDSAATLYTKATALVPHEAVAYGNLGMLERGASARKQLELAVRLAPTSPQSVGWLLELGRLYSAQAQPSHAKRALHRALKLAPHSARGHAALATAHARAHEYDRAHQHARTADALEASVPACIRWNAVLPRSPELWGGPRQRGAYRELVLGCGAQHAKRSRMAWVDATRLHTPPAALPYADSHFDEVHWCATAGRSAAAEAAGAAVSQDAGGAGAGVSESTVAAAGQTAHTRARPIARPQAAVSRPPRCAPMRPLLATRVTTPKASRRTCLGAGPSCGECYGPAGSSSCTLRRRRRARQPCPPTLRRWNSPLCCSLWMRPWRTLRTEGGTRGCCIS